MIGQASESEVPCAQCGNCCRWSGFIRIQPEEAEAIAGFMGLPILNFTERYTQLLPSRQGLSLNEAEDGACVFLESNACRIHNVKPRQCRDFPTAWNRKESNSPCPL